MMTAASRKQHVRKEDSTKAGRKKSGYRKALAAFARLQSTLFLRISRNVGRFHVAPKVLDCLHVLERGPMFYHRIHVMNLSGARHLWSL
jgi:hypothetical protein